MSDRNFKLRQMFCDHIYNPKAKVSLFGATSPSNQTLLISGLTDADKKRVTLRKIVEEEEEIFETPQNYRPVIIKSSNIDLKWIDSVVLENQKRPVIDENTRMGQRILAVLEKSELLETLSMRSEEVRHIQCFFMDDSEPPGEKLVIALDNLLTKCITQLSQFSDKMPVQIDLDMRRYFQDANKAKCTIVETILQNPHLMPESWARENAMRVREAITVEARKRDAEDKINQKKMKEERMKEQKAKEEAVAAAAASTPSTPPTPTVKTTTNNSGKIQKKRSDRTVSSFKTKKPKKADDIATKEEKTIATPSKADPKVGSNRMAPTSATPNNITPPKTPIISPDAKPVVKSAAPAAPAAPAKPKAEKTSNVKNTSLKGSKQSKSKPTKTVPRKK